MKRTKNKNNFKRDIINNDNLLDVLEQAKLSSRNKDIMIKYASGVSYKELANEYNVTSARITQIIWTCITRCHNVKDPNF